MANSRNLTEIDEAASCPCESGRKYNKCCKKRGMKWKVNDQGDHWLEKPLPPQALEQMRELKEDFIDTFGRQPTPGDKLFQLSEPYLRRTALRAMRKANISPPLVYAYIQTGLIVANRKQLTGRDQQLWDSAIDEYYSLSEEIGEFDPDEEGAVEEVLVDQLRRNQRIGGSFVDRHFNHYRQRAGASREIESVAGFLTANFVRGISSVIVLVEGEASYDAYNILRSMYKNYVTLAFIYHNPGRVGSFTAQLGILLGTHTYATNKKGVEIQSEIVELATGKRTSIPSRWEMARELGPTHEYLYQTLYRDLSSICHPDMTGLQNILSKDGYDYLNPVSSINALSTAHLLCALNFSLLQSTSPCINILKHDLKVATGRSFFELTILRKVISPTHGINFPKPFEIMLDELMQRNPHLQLLADSIEKSTVTAATPFA